MQRAREQLAAGSDPRRGGAADGSVPGTTHEGELQGMPPALPGRAPAAVPPADAVTTSAASTLRGMAWPASELGAPLLRLVSALVAQVTAQAGAAQCVVAALPWCIGMGQRWGGALNTDQPPLLTWMTRTKSG